MHVRTPVWEERTPRIDVMSCPRGACFRSHVRGRALSGNTCSGTNYGNAYVNAAGNCVACPTNTHVNLPLRTSCHLCTSKVRAPFPSCVDRARVCLCVRAFVNTRASVCLSVNLCVRLFVQKSPVVC